MDPRGEQQQKVGDPNDRNTGSGVDKTQQRTQPVGDREYDDVEKRFKSEPLAGERKQIHTQIMFGTKDLATKLIENIPNNRERALALTRLEEVGFWCEKALIHGANV